MLKPLSSAISIGTGGPFGAEGPIIMTGGAIGSLFAQLFHLSAAERKTLLVAGAAAGMTGVFGTPIAAVLLAVELLLFEWKPRSFIPVVVACAVAAAGARPFLLAGGAAVPRSPAPALPPPGLAPRVARRSACVAGLRLRRADGAGLRQRGCVRPPEAVHWMWWPALGGLVVGLGGLVEPRALGVGYDIIARPAVRPRSVLGAVAVLLLVKAVIWVGRARLRHLGRRAGAAADHGRRAGRAGRAHCCRTAARASGRCSAWRR